MNKLVPVLFLALSACGSQMDDGYVEEIDMSNDVNTEIGELSEAYIRTVQANPQPLTYWWYSTTSAFRDRTRAAIECAVSRWSLASGLPVDISFDAHHWIRMVTAEGLGHSGGEISGGWSSVRIKITEDMLDQTTCNALIHEIGHQLRLSNSHPCPQGSESYVSVNSSSLITQCDLDQVCAVRACVDPQPEVQ